jgi:hypothetical protein
MKNNNILIGDQPETLFLARNRLMQFSILLLLFLTAFGIRLFGITNIPMDYHPVKQYRSALTARAIYYSHLEDINELEKKTALASLKYIGILGPPIVDYIAASAYTTLGTEILWIPKLLSTIYWIIGGLFLYLIALEMMNADAAILCTAIYLFLPFGVLSSQSFQPDPLMIMAMIISVYTIIIYHSRPSAKMLFIAGIVSAVAILIKPVSVFIVFGAYLGYHVHCKGLTRNFFFDQNLIIFSLIALLPSTLYYGYGIVNTTTLDQQAQKSFVPQLFFQFNFWDGWLKRIKIALGFDIFIGSLLSAFLFIPGWQKKLIFGMWSGYFLMCLVFNYTISTHDYYHLPLFPIAALSLGPAAALLLNELRTQTNRWYLELGVWVLLAIALFLSAGTTIQASRRLPEYEKEIRIAEEVGEAVYHSTNTIMLAPYDGKPLMYYGKLAGEYWPYWYDIRDEKLWGVKDMNPIERVRSVSKDMDLEYFIITDLEELENQSDLKDFLDKTYPIWVKKPEYVIYQLSR